MIVIRVYSCSFVVPFVRTPSTQSGVNSIKAKLAALFPPYLLPYSSVALMNKLEISWTIQLI